jgi:tetratricopeptide (TPR) repeat protein
LLFLPHELVMFRGACSFYMGQLEAAMSDFESALELTCQVMEALPRPEPAPIQGEEVSAPLDLPQGGGCLLRSPSKMLPKEATTLEGLAQFECMVLVNVILCRLMVGDYQAALATSARLLEQRGGALAELGAQAQSLAWFLAGVCRLALGDAYDEVAREAFQKSYGYDPAYVDDFLRRHSRATGWQPPQRPVGSPPAAGGGPPTAGSSGIVCDAAPEAICSLHRDRDKTSPSLTTYLPPCRMPVKSVVIWARPSIGWPFVGLPEPTMPMALGRLDLLPS